MCNVLRWCLLLDICWKLFEQLKLAVVWRLKNSVQYQIHQRCLSFPSRRSSFARLRRNACSGLIVVIWRARSQLSQSFVSWHIDRRRWLSGMPVRSALMRVQVRLACLRSHKTATVCVWLSLNRYPPAVLISCHSCTIIHLLSLRTGL